MDSRARALARAILQYSFGDGAFGRSLRRRGHDELIDRLIWQDETFGATYWAMETREDGRFLGFCGLVTVDEDDSTGGWPTSKSNLKCWIWWSRSRFRSTKWPRGLRASLTYRILPRLARGRPGRPVESILTLFGSLRLRQKGPVAAQWRSLPGGMAEYSGSAGAKRCKPSVQCRF